MLRCRVITESAGKLTPANPDMKCHERLDWVNWCEKVESPIHALRQALLPWVISIISIATETCIEAIKGTQ